MIQLIEMLKLCLLKDSEGNTVGCVMPPNLLLSEIAVSIERLRFIQWSIMEGISLRTHCHTNILSYSRWMRDSLIHYCSTLAEIRPQVLKDQCTRFGAIWYPQIAAD